MSKHVIRLTFLGIILAACGGDSRPESGTSIATATTASTAPLPPGVLPAGPSALDDIDDPDLPTPLVDPLQVISGGPAPDGIPSIDDPVFRSQAEAEASLEDTEAVVVLEIAGDARAYPVEILVWHEIVNDTVGGVPVAVTYCPLCNSAITYERKVRGVETTFGTSGSLYASSLVMYDRATESLWTHFDGRAIAGVLTGDILNPIASPLLSWGEFKSSFPDGLVLSRETGYQRNYGQNPYFGYDNPETAPFLFRGEIDDRALAKQRVVGVAIGFDAVAFTLEVISGGEARATAAMVGDTEVLILWKAGQTTALQGANTSDGRDVGSVGVYLPIAGGVPLSFRAAGGLFIDEETGSTWDVTGKAIEGELTGTKLEALPHLDTFWFAWSAFRPDTALIQ